MRKLINRIPELIQEYEQKTGRKVLQKDIAAKTGIQESTLSRYINDRTDSFNRHILERLCTYFDCEVGDILQLEPPEKAS